MFGEKIDKPTENSKSFVTTDGGYGSLVSSDKDNNWTMQAKIEAVEKLERMLPWLVSIQKFEELMQQ